MRGASRFRRVFLIVLTGWIFAGTIFVIAMFASGQWRFVYDVQITDFVTCYGPHPRTGEPMNPTNIFPVDVERIYACGHLVSSTSVDLGFEWYRDGKHIHGSLDQHFGPDEAFIYYALKPPKGQAHFRPGHYRVDVYHGRQKLASIEFEVVPVGKEE